MIYIRTNSKNEYRCVGYDKPRDLVDLIILNDVSWVNCNGVFVNTKNIESVYDDESKYRNGI